MPQYLLNQFAESIARGEMRAALLCGGEALRTQHGLERARRGRRRGTRTRAAHPS